jgi:hypothetical protein
MVDRIVLSEHAKKRCTQRNICPDLALRIAREEEPGVQCHGLSEKVLARPDGMQIVVRMHGSSQTVATVFWRSPQVAEELGSQRRSRGMGIMDGEAFSLLED